MRLPWVDLECYRMNDEIFAFQFEDMSLTVPRALYDFPEGTLFFFRARDTGRYPGRPDAGAGIEIVKHSASPGYPQEGAPANGMHYTDRTLYLDITPEDTEPFTRDARLDWEMDAVIPGRGRQTLCRGSLHVRHIAGLNDPETARAGIGAGA